MMTLVLQVDTDLLQKKTGGDISSKASNVLIGYCSFCNRKMSKNVIDNTIQEEGLCSFFKNLGRISAEAGKKIATNVIKNPDRALKKTSNTATTAATKNPKAAVSSLPKVIKFNPTDGGLYLGKFV